MFTHPFLSYAPPPPYASWMREALRNKIQVDMATCQARLDSLNAQLLHRQRGILASALQRMHAGQPIFEGQPVAQPPPVPGYPAAASGGQHYGAYPGTTVISAGPGMHSAPPAPPCPALPCPALPCPALPRPAPPRPALPCPALPCPASPLLPTC